MGKTNICSDSIFIMNIKPDKPLHINKSLVFTRRNHLTRPDSEKLFYKKVLIKDSISFTSKNIEENPALLKTYGAGKLFIKDKTHILELHGSFKQMGLQYGNLQKDRINDFYDDIVKVYSEMGLIKDFDKFIMSSVTRIDSYSDDMKEFISGISEGSGIEYHKIAAINSLMELIETGCSCIIAKEGFSKSGKTIMGRNFDYPSFFSKFNKYLDVVILNPENAKNSIMMPTYTGQISAPQIFNSSGLALEVNNGIINDRPKGYNDPVTFLEPLLKNTDLKSLKKDLKKMKAKSPIIFNVMDNNNSKTFEYTQDKVKTTSGAIKGLLVSTNNFINSAWSKAIAVLKFDTTLSAQRRANLINLAVGSKKNIDANKMMEILDTPLEKGGATFPHATIYQFVYEPDQQKLFIKSSGYQNWNEISLSRHIKN